jgi:hypothetical protein
VKLDSFSTVSGESSSAFQGLKMQFSVAMNKTAIRCISRGYRIRLGTGVDVFFFMFDHIHTRLFSCLKYLQYYGICGIL